MSLPPPSARAWSVAKLRALHFEGDADALAAYVDALIDNNRDEENADPALLREQATTDLADFLGNDAALQFVDGLMAFLAAPAPAPISPPAPAPTDQATQLQQPPATDDTSDHPDRDNPPATTAPPQPSANHRPQQQHPPPQRHIPPQSHRRRSPPPRSSNGHPSPASISRPARPAKPSVIDRLGARKPAPPQGQRPAKRGRDMDDMDDPDRHQRRRRPNLADARRAIEAHRAISPPRRGGPARRDRAPVSNDRRYWPDDMLPQGRDSRRVHVERIMNELPNQSWDNKKPGDKDGKRTGPLAPPFGFPPMISPEMMLKFPPPFPPGMMPPPPPGMLPGGSMGNNSGPRGPFRGGRGRDGRGRDGRDGRDARDNRHDRGDRDNRPRGTPRGGDGEAGGGQSGRKQYFVLAMRNVPEDKLKLPHILKFLEMYGTPDNVQLVTPDRAFIIYSTREPALAAVKSVDAVMGNRHIRLAWATAMDYDHAGLELTDEGVLKPSANRRKGNRDDRDRRTEKSDRRGLRKDIDRGEAPARKNAVESTQASEAASAAQKEQEKQEAAKAAEEDLKKKRAAIAEARAKQEEEKASLQARKKQLVDEQKALFAEMAKTADQMAKLELFRKAKAIESQLKQVVSGLNPALAASVQSGQSRSSATTPASSHPLRGGLGGRGRGRGRGGRFDGFTVDNRPKTLQIMGANPGIAIEMAMTIFHETLSAEKVGAFWLLNFASRRAAESALRARGPLKRGFGPAAMSQIVAGSQSTSPQVQGTEAGAEHAPSSVAATVAFEQPASVPAEPASVPMPETNQSGLQPMAMSLGMAQSPSAMMIDSAEGGPPPAQPIAE